MNVLKITDSDAVSRAVEVLCAGGIVMYPTETCYGLGVDVSNKTALRKLYALKGRDENKPFSILVDGFVMAHEYGTFSQKADELARKYWPGPLSVLVLGKKTLPGFFNRGTRFVSIRYSSNDFCTRLVRAFGFPITSTSANLSGEPPLYEPLYFAGADLIIDGGKLFKNAPSTLVKVDGDKFEVLRRGVLDLGEEVQNRKHRSESGDNQNRA